jgi:hypothetical protein
LVSTVICEQCHRRILLTRNGGQHHLTHSVNRQEVDAHFGGLLDGAFHGLPDIVELEIEKHALALRQKPADDIHSGGCRQFQSNVVKNRVIAEVGASTRASAAVATSSATIKGEVDIHFRIGDRRPEKTGRPAHSALRAPGKEHPQAARRKRPEVVEETLPIQLR